MRRGFFPEVAPPDAGFPHATYTLVSDVRPLHLTGPAGYGIARIQIDLWGDGTRQGYAAARAVKGVLDGLNGYRGNMGSVFVQQAAVEDALSNADPHQSGKSLPDRRITLEVTLWYECDTDAAFAAR